MGLSSPKQEGAQGDALRPPAASRATEVHRGAPERPPAAVGTAGTWRVAGPGASVAPQSPARTRDPDSDTLTRPTWAAGLWMGL